jgi:hypothetical protein
MENCRENAAIQWQVFCGWINALRNLGAEIAAQVDSMDDDYPSQGGHNMIATRLERRAAIVVLSTSLILPFAVLELVNNRAARSDFPVALFAFMWLNALALTALIVSISRTLRSPGRRYTVSLAVRALAAIALAWMGVAGIVDQMPCFLGVPNCD